VPVLKEDGIALNSVPLTAETLRQADCVIIVTDHAAIDYKLIARHARVIVDTRHVLPKTGGAGAGAGGAGGAGSRA